QWELLLIDNASTEELSAHWDLTWHSQGRHIRENELGLTPARLRGIQEGRGDILVFVDDDNVLQHDYLLRTTDIAHQWPQLGAWSGAVIPEFEVQPAHELRDYLWSLCIREVKTDCWSNQGDFDSTPWGAGMCTRRQVATAYTAKTSSDPLRKSLDRRGSSLGSTGDIDLALTSLDFGLGTGVFRDLRLVHLIPARRVTEDYLLALIEQSTASYHVQLALAGRTTPRQESRIDQWVARYKEFCGTPIQKKVDAARRRGLRKAKTILASASLNSL
ncbi:MAG TPA: family 2 glycosyl transferase, partial [Planctomycetaceae bacterium]|nr:family 2 glycosyl transferase [Planctomycetaceae bacterium]